MKTRETWASSKGFTLMEMVLVVGVMAILVGLTTPTLIQFLRQKDVRDEETQLALINKAMASYAAANNALPDPTVTNTTLTTFWANDLAKFTNLSPNQILMDTWGNQRRYVATSVNDTFIGTTIPVLYATVHTMGPDAKAQGGTNIATASNLFSTATASSWWRQQSNPVTAFQAIAIANGSDDMITRFSDYADKVERYNTTQERLQKIAAALETYSKQKFAEAVAAGVANPERYIYYPRSLGVVSTASDPAGYYANNVRVDTALYATNQYVSANSSVDATRRTQMINLMRILGLPDGYCCSALSTFNNGGIMQEKPFFYFSNPRPHTSATACGSRVDPSTGALPLSPRVTLDNVADGTTGATCG